MTIRIWFTTEDLARTRVAGPDPLAETVFSLIPLRTGGLPGWSRTTLRRLAAPLRPLAGMFPVYPAPPASVGSAQLGAGPADRTLSGLIGPTRSKVLAAAAGGATTTELARRVGISMSSASEHARILREAGLLRTERRGSAVQHRLTDLAVRLLDGRDRVVTRDVLPADFGVGRRALR